MDATRRRLRPAPARRNGAGVDRLRGVQSAVPALYAYTSEAADIGNSEDLRGEAKLHLSYFYRGLARVLKPGRVAVVHVMQIPRMKRAADRGCLTSAA
jgi:hypothetical protein